MKELPYRGEPMSNSWQRLMDCISNLSSRVNMMSNSHLLSLADLATQSGSLIDCAGNLPLDLNDPDSVWFVEAGAVDIFLVEQIDGKEQTAPQQLTHSVAGDLIPSIACQVQQSTLSLIAKGLPGTQLRRLSILDLAKVQSDDLSRKVDTWVMAISDTLSRDIMFPSLPDVLVEAGQTSAPHGNVFSVKRGVAWLNMPDQSSAVYIGLVDIGTNGQHQDISWVPLAPTSWIEMSTSQSISRIKSTMELVEGGQIVSVLARFHELVLETERMNRLLTVVDQANLERVSLTVRHVEEDRARRKLFEVPGISKIESSGDGSELDKALLMIGQHEGIKFKFPDRTGAPETPPALANILLASKVPGRKIRLDRMSRWWVGDSGAMLAYKKDTNQPVALLPDKLNRYHIHDSATGRKTRITTHNAGSIKPEAWLFYRPFESREVHPRELLQVFSDGLGMATTRFLITGFAGGLIMLLSAFVLGFVASQVIPAREYGLLHAVAMGLVILAGIWALIHILQGMALMRIEGRIASRIEAAFWDRLRRLPLSLLHQYPSADRAMRGMVFQRLRDTIQGVAINNILSIIFLLPALFIIYFYDIGLGLVTTAFGLLSLFVTVILGLGQISPYERLIRASHRLTGVLFQLINGIAKLRIDGAEGSAYAVWARNYGEQQRAEIELGAWQSRLLAFGSALPLLAAAAIMATISLDNAEIIGLADFLIVYVAFLLFVTGVVRLGFSFGAAAAIVPEIAQIQPFLAKAPEASFGQVPVEYLGGNLVFDHVSFRYDPDSPLILDDISMHINSGEFVAIAGRSGSGKSTLFHLALGLNENYSGTISFDGRDLRQLNVKQVRQQIGMVPQKAELHPQDIWDNIVSDQEGIDATQVWQAAEIADVKEEILRMPMQLLTSVGDSQSGLSGGETQRITIARALVRNPRIMLLDEATNLLDNKSQSNIMKQLSNLPMTRIVIAHRLSTLREADRIYVLEKGKFAEQGTYQELIAADGLFRELVRRQEY
ncbi:MAG: ATP-binding cassette domain-containing protein [Gammaproteobacteria bacterium]|nr:ATP-binding cassette domain-containing protein [Gammaproteobacteria bacterium]